jgi:hypothetical protein
MDDNQSFTWFDRFPTEIIFDIFDYLSNNDIIYTFFYLNQRLNRLLLDYERYLIHFEQPTKNLDFWKTIFSIVGKQTKSLSITSNDLSFPLNIFPNLKSIKISSSFPFDYHHLSSIIQNEQFNKLESLKIESNFFLQKSPYTHHEDMEKILFEKVFTSENSLQIFDYSPNTSIVSLERIPNLAFNLNIQSLSLKKFPLTLALSIIQYAPNLNYLNIIATTFSIEHEFLQTLNLSNIQLRKLYLTFDSNTEQGYNHHELIILTDIIKEFSASLICLSIDVSNAESDRNDEVPFNGVKLQQQLLQAMIELKQFHLYAKFSQDRDDVQNILSTFSNAFWFDHNWSVGIHGNYLYTLPFLFNKLNDFISFDDVTTTNSEILNNNSSTWYNVQSIELSKSNEFNFNFIKQLRIRMPKLISIKINVDYLNNIPDTTENKTLNTVTTIHLTGGSLNNLKPWFIQILTNLKYLILSDADLFLAKNDSAPILTEKIQRLTILTNSTLEQLTKMSNIFFSNVRHIQLTICFKFQKSEIYANEVKKILTCFKNLNQLSINLYGRGNWPDIELTTMLKYLNTNHIERNYRIKRYHEYILFLKKSMI